MILRFTLRERCAVRIGYWSTVSRRSPAPQARQAASLRFDQRVTGQQLSFADRRRRTGDRRRSWLSAEAEAAGP